MAQCHRREASQRASRRRRAAEVIGYLLNPAHPDNGGKARFFQSLGFSKDDPERLVTALRVIAEDEEVTETAASAHGEKYVVDGWLTAHTEESHQRLVRTVWIIDHGREAHRLVTAYPARSEPAA